MFVPVSWLSFHISFNVKSLKRKSLKFKRTVSKRWNAIGVDGDWELVGEHNRLIDNWPRRIIDDNQNFIQTNLKNL